MPGPYKLEGLSFASTVAITNKASYVAYRGPWAAETFVRERMINLIAAELGMDPLEIRLRNVVTRGEPPESMINGRSLAGVTARESLERIAKVVDFDELPAPPAGGPGRRPLPRDRYGHLHRGRPRSTRRGQRPRRRADPGRSSRRTAP